MTLHRSHHFGNCNFSPERRSRYGKMFDKDAQCNRNKNTVRVAYGQQPGRIVIQFGFGCRYDFYFMRLQVVNGRAPSRIVNRVYLS